jgi:3-phenylpropionate/cinnamic acid dioxygenase small subunit
MYLEYQEDRQEVYAGVAWHHLKREGNEVRIALKKVELLNCEAALPSLQLFL